MFSTPTLGLDSGRKCTQHFALQKDVAVKVSGKKFFFNISLREAIIEKKVMNFVREIIP